MSDAANARQADRLYRTAQRLERGIGLPPVIDVDDLAQEQAIAEMLARVRVDADRPAEEQRSFLARRRQGAAIDAMRAAADNVPTVRIDALADDKRAALDDAFSVAAAQEGEAVLVRACRSVLGLPPPLPLIFTALVAGATRQHLAAHLGVSASRISQHCADLSAALALHFDLPHHQGVP